MAIQSRIVNNSFTEIYVGGGNSITQSAPTNFHKFCTRRILTPTENISDYKEVTASERAAIEAADAKWEAPSEGFIAQCEAAGAVYNRATGFFELNGLMDITVEQMKAILYTPWGIYNNRMQCPINIRTNLRGAFPYTGYAWVENSLDLTNSFIATHLEALWLWNDHCRVNSLGATFYNSTRLKIIYGSIAINKITDRSYLRNAFGQCYALVTVRIEGLNASIDLFDSPLLSLNSLTYLVNNAVNTAPITVTVHPEVYAKLTATEHSAQARSNLALNSDVPVTSANYPMKQYPLNTVVKTGDALTVTVWGTPSEGSYLYAVIENCGVEGNLVEISPGVWQKTFVLKGEKATAPHLNIYNNPNNRLEGHIDKVKICYGLDPSPQWSAPVEMPTDPEAIEAIGWERVMLIAAAKQINFATT